MDAEFVTFVVQTPPPQSTPVFLNFHVLATLHITAAEARKQVNRQIIPELGTGLIADEPALALFGQQVTWRVPISLSLPALGTLGQVGAVDVDARTGEVLHDDAAQERMVRHARWLYLGATAPENAGPPDCVLIQ